MEDFGFEGEGYGEGGGYFGINEKKVEEEEVGEANKVGGGIEEWE